MPTERVDDVGRLLEHIDQLVGWLPKRDRRVPAVIRGAQLIMRGLLVEGTISHADIVSLYASASLLDGGPLRTLLLRRITELERIGPLSRNASEPSNHFKVARPCTTPTEKGLARE